jgi:predicted nucleic-acid-binding protein
MVILIDTNVILDYLTARQPFTDNADKIVILCFRQKCYGYIAAHSITNVFYILRKQFSASERKKLLIELCEFIDQRHTIHNSLFSIPLTDYSPPNTVLAL